MHPDLYLLLIPVGIVAALHIARKMGKLPRVTWGTLPGKNGTNNLFSVKVDPAAKYPLAVLAQELYESDYKWHPRVIAVRLSKAAQREMEYRGHEVEVQAAVELYGADEDAHRRDEGEVMHYGYDGIFKHLLVPEIISEMEKHTIMAKQWVQDNKDRLRK